MDPDSRFESGSIIPKWIRIQVRTEDRDPNLDPYCSREFGSQICTSDTQILTPVEDPDPHQRPICERLEKCSKDKNDFFGAQISVMLGTEPDVIHTVAVNDQKCHFLHQFLLTLSGSLS